MDRSFENLRVWQDSRKFVNDIYDMMENCRDFGFRDQIQRAAVSIMNNIAEGCESGSDAKYIYFLNISKGSCGEVRSIFTYVKIESSVLRNKDLYFITTLWVFQVEFIVLSSSFSSLVDNRPLTIDIILNR